MDLDYKADSLMDSWPDWCAKILEFSKVESDSRPLIKKILQRLEEADNDCPEGLIWLLMLEIIVSHWPFSDIWPAKIHFGWPNLLYIFNQKCPISKTTAEQFLTLISTTGLVVLAYIITVLINLQTIKMLPTWNYFHGYYIQEDLERMFTL